MTDHSASAPDLEPYLRPDIWIDSGHPAILRCAREITGEAAPDNVEAARRLYLFVRDAIAHSWDAERSEVNGTASAVLQGGHGICYGKSHLLAALLRAVGIPAGIAYQRLTLFDDPAEGFAVHALNTVYLADRKRWVRLDARGNKPGINATFSLEEERLAFPVRPEIGERDYGVNHATPHPAIAQTLSENADLREMYRNHLPACLEYPV